MKTSFILSTIVKYFFIVCILFISQNGLAQQSLHFQFDEVPNPNVGDTINFTDGPNLVGTSFTIEFWAKRGIPAGSDNRETVIEIGDEDMPGKNLRIFYSDTNEMKFSMHKNNFVVVNYADSIDQQWHHWAFSFKEDDHTCKLYLNGTLVEDGTLDAFEGNTAFKIGNDIFNHGYTGLLDELRIWSDVRTIDEINDNMFIEINNNPNNLIAYFPFNEGNTDGENLSLNNLRNRGSDTYDGTLNGFELTGSVSNWVNEGFPRIEFTTNPKSAYVSLGGSHTFEVATDSNNPNLTYQWYKNDEPIAGANSFLYTINNIDVDDFAVYSCRVSIGSGYIHSSTAWISSNFLSSAVDSSDAYIDIDWALPSIPCIVDNDGNPYSEYTTRLLADGQEIDIQNFGASTLQDVVNNSMPYFLSTYLFSQGPSTIEFDMSQSADYFVDDEDYTIEFWVKNNNNSFGNRFFFDQDNIENRCYLQYNRFYIRKNGNARTQPLPINIDGWNHFAMATENGQTRIYHNGIYYETLDKKLNLSEINGFGKGLSNFDFQLGEFRIWNIRRSDQEIMDNIVLNESESQEHLLMRYMFADGEDMVDLAYAYDGVSNDITSLNDAVRNDFDFPANAGILGSYRHFTGPDEDVNYELQIFHGTFGQQEPDCTGATSAGASLPVQAPTLIAAGNDLLDRNRIQWRTNSDLATSIKILRDDNLLTTYTENISKGDTILHEDIFNKNNQNGIKSGVIYPYTLKMFSDQVSQEFTYDAGLKNTLDINFNASDSMDHNNKVVLNWESLELETLDDLQLKRNDNLYRVLMPEQTQITDFSPYNGDSTNYSLHVIHNDTTRAVFYDFGAIPPSGKIAGRVLTEQNLFPVADVNLTLTRQSNSTEYMTTTDINGAFSFVGLPFGLLDSFLIEATFENHEFIYPVQSIKLNLTTTKIEDIVIFDKSDYTETASTQEIHQFEVTADSISDLVWMTWQSEVEDTENMFIDIVANGEVIFTSTDPVDTTQIKPHLDGDPNEEIIYKLRVYNIEDTLVSVASASNTAFFPPVSRIPTGNFIATKDSINNEPTGNVRLNWIHTSNNIDAFRIYRNNELLVELDKSINEYLDDTAPFDIDISYQITALRFRSDITFETEDPTFAIPDTINLGSYPIPTNIEVFAIPQDPNITITWSSPMGITSDFDFDGYCLYRDGILIDKIHKSHTRKYKDYRALGGEDITYEVSTFKTSDNGYLTESDRIESATIDFPDFNEVPLLQSSTSSQEVLLSWDAIQYNSVKSNYKGFIIYRNGEELVRLPATADSYSDYPESGQMHDYDMRVYQHLGEYMYISEMVSSTSVAVPSDSDILVAPFNVTISRDLPNHVKLCWEYFDFLPSKFIIYKDGIVLDTLSRSSRTYFDYNAAPEDYKIEYAIQAIQPGVQSVIKSFIGDMIDPKRVYGQVLDATTHVGIPQARISFEVLGIQTIAAYSNEEGYFSFLLPNEYIGESVVIRATPGPDTEVVTDSVLIGTSHNYPITLLYEDPLPNVSEELASITSVSIDTDTFDLAGILHWQTSGPDFTGVLIFRGLNEVANIPQGEPTYWRDEDATPGINYTYILRSFLDDDNGRIFGDSSVISYTYPKIDPAAHLLGAAQSELNQVTIQWSHRFDHQDGFEVLRNDEFLATIPKGSPMMVIDQNGIAGRDYNYTVIAYKDIDGERYYSEERTITLTFPEIGKVQFLAAEAIESNIDGTSYYANHIDLSWEYEGANVTNFKIFRNDDPIAVIEADSLLYSDYDNIPGSQNTYAVSALVSTDGTITESDAVDLIIDAPSIQSPIDFHVESDSQLGLIHLEWTYPFDGIRGFKIYRDGDTLLTESNLIETITDLSDDPTHVYRFNDLSPAPGESLYYGIVAFDVRGGISYASDLLIENKIMPSPISPTNVQATDGIYDNAIGVTWEYDFEANSDAFLISRYNTITLASDSILIFDRLARSYLDTFPSDSYPDIYEYTVKNCRVVDNIQYCNSPFPVVDTGFIKMHTSIDTCFEEGNVKTQLGHSVAMDGEWMVAGLPEAEKIKIYRIEEGEWQFFQEISDTTSSINPSTTNRFGHAVAIDGDWMVVGKPEADDGSGPRYGGANIYNFNGTNWVYTESKGIDVNQVKSGFSVAIDSNIIVIGRPYFAFENNNSDFFDDAIRIYRYNGSSWKFVNIDNNSIPSNLVFTSTDGDSRSFWPEHLGWSVAINGDTILAGDPFATVYKETNFEVQQDAGYAVEYHVNGNDAEPVKLIYTENALATSPLVEYFGFDVAIRDSYAAISALFGRKNGVISGRVNVFERLSDGNWDETQTIFTESSPVPDARFGYSLDMHNDLLAITEPFSSGTSGQDSKLSILKLQNGIYDVVQSPLPSSSNYRREFYDNEFSADLYPPLFGSDVAISDQFLVVGAPDRVDPMDIDIYSEGDPPGLGQGKAFIFELNPVDITQFNASDGTFVDTKLEWTIECAECDSESIDSVYIYRDQQLIGKVSANISQFIDKEENTFNNVPEALSGEEYTYEISVKMKGIAPYTTPKVQDNGYSKRKGKVSGAVFVQGTNIGVPSVSINISAIDQDGHYYFKDTLTAVDGTFNFEDLFVSTDGTEYMLSAQYEDHTLEFVNPPNVTLTTEDFSSINNVINDVTSYVVTGSVTTEGTICGQDGVMVDYFEVINGIRSLNNSVEVINGVYSIIVNPNVSGLEAIEINMEDVQTQVIGGENISVQHEFTTVGNVITDLPNPDILTEINFIDELKYSVPIHIVNTCLNPIADQSIEVRIASHDGCVDTTIQTNINGYALIDLVPKNYNFTVVDIIGAGVNSYENAAINYLKSRPSVLNLQDIHIAVGADELPDIDPVHLIYHKAIDFSSISSFDRYLCNDISEPAIISQGENHLIQFFLSEFHRPGEDCPVSTGYLQIRNPAAIDPSPLIIEVLDDEVFDYNFVAGSPNLVQPYVHTMSAQLFSDEGIFLGSTSIPIIVEGQRILPGTGFETQADTDDAGNVLLPLYVLRDPPGDNSFSRLEENTTINKTITIGSEEGVSYGEINSLSVAVVGLGAFYESNIENGSQNNKDVNYDISFSTSQSFATSALESGIGRSANVIVGGGLGTLYGLNQNLQFSDNCEPELNTTLSFGVSDFNTTFAYTVKFIEGLIDKYENDLTLIENGQLIYVDSDGKEYNTTAALDRTRALKAAWENMLHYHDVETLPHYVLCNDISYRDDLPQSTIDEYEEWKYGFCNLIGNYEDDVFIMNENITWTPSLINAYNNTIAYTDTIKKIPNGIINNNLKLSENEIDAVGLAVTQNFHNLLGTNIKSAEILDISGGITFEKTVSAQQSSSTSYNITNFETVSENAGVFISRSTSVSVGTPIGLSFSNNIFNADGKMGFISNKNASISISKSQAESNSTEVYYQVSDDDIEDQIAFLTLQAPIQNQTPFFIRLGGLSSCPQEEALTINQDNDPLLIDDFVIAVAEGGGTTSNPKPQHNVPQDQAAVYEVKLSNLGPTINSRDARVVLDLESNSFGATVKLGGSDLNITSPTFTIPQNGTITQFLTIERPQATGFFDFEGIRVGIQPDCGGPTKWITLDTYYKSPCSSVTISSPINGKVVRRNGPNNLEGENVMINLIDYESDNENLEYIQLQYRNLTIGQDWQIMPDGQVLRSELEAEDFNLAEGTDPLFQLVWDIEGQYNKYPNGTYLIRAQAFCASSGVRYSNEVELILDRSDVIATGFPEPTDQIFSMGDEISVTYSTDLDCGLINVTDSVAFYLSLIDLEDWSEVPFVPVCMNNKVTLEIPDSLDYDGHTLRATYQNLTSPSGNPAETVVWDFKVVTQKVDWQQEAIEVALCAGEETSFATTVFNTTGIKVSNLMLTGMPSWLSSPNVDFNVPVIGKTINFDFNANLEVGIYSDTVMIEGPEIVGRIPALKVIMDVRACAPDDGDGNNAEKGTYSESRGGDDIELTDSMAMVLNWRFVPNGSVSKDTFDQIEVRINGTSRGAGRIEKFGEFFAANFTIYGNDSETGDDLDFVIWNSDQALAYVPISGDEIDFEPNLKHGIISNPEILLVEDDLFQYKKRIYVDSSNVSGIKNGESWTTAFDDLQDALEVAYDGDTIWIAGGTYFPSVNDRSIAFDFCNNIAVYGGFEGTESSLNQRNGSATTILSGNIGDPETSADNVYHTVTATASSFLIERLEIRDGNADGLGELGKGACMYNTGGATLIECNMKYGDASEGGRLIYNSGNMIIDDGTYTLSSDNGISSLLNAEGGQITVKRNVRFEKD